MNTIVFKNQVCIAKKLTYPNGNLVIQLYKKESQEPVATATVNLGEKLTHGLAYIKDYSENKGIFEALYDAGYINRVVTVARSGFFIVPLVEVNLDLLQ